MKKAVILFTVFSVALGIALIAVGIWLCSDMKGWNSDDNFANIILYLFALMIEFVFVLCILLGIPFLFTGPLALIAFFKEDLPRIKKHLRITKLLNTPLLVLLLLSVLNSIGSFFDWTDKSMTVFKIVELLLTALSLATEITAIIVGRKIKQAIQQQWRPD